MNIFIVDDDSNNHHYYKCCLRRQVDNLQISSFFNGKTIYEYYLKHFASPEKLPDIILLDINMPEMTGYDFIRALKILRSQIEKMPRIHIISGSHSPYEICDCSDIIESFETKPISSDRLVEIIKSQPKLKK